MFSLITGFYRWLTEREERRLIIVGVDNAGKTTTLEQLKRNNTGKGMDPDRIPPTVGLNVGRITMDGVDAVFWDVGGQIALRDLWSSYYEECNGIIFVVDSSDEKRLRADVTTALNQVLSDRRLAGKPLALLCNKNDLPNALPASEVEDILDITERVDRPMKVFSVSALKNEGIDEAMHWVLREARKNSRCCAFPTKVVEMGQHSKKRFPRFGVALRSFGLFGVALRSFGFVGENERERPPEEGHQRHHHHRDHQQEKEEPERGAPSSSSAIPSTFDKPPLTARTHLSDRINISRMRIDDLIFRQLKPDDYDEVEQLHNEWFPVHYDQGFFKAATNGDCYSLAAAAGVSRGPTESTSPTSEEDVILGIITVSTGRTAETEDPEVFLEVMRHNPDFFSTMRSREQSLAYMLTLGTVDEVRGRGLASELVLRALEDVKQHHPDCGAMFLHVIDYNKTAIRMYEKLGFQCVGFHEAFYTIEGDPYNAYTYAYYYPPTVLPISVFTGLSWFKPLFSTVRTSFRNFVTSDEEPRSKHTPD